MSESRHSKIANQSPDKRISILSMPSHENLQPLRFENLNIPGSEFITKTVVLEGIKEGEWRVKGEALSSNSSKNFKERSLKPHDLTDAIEEIGKVTGVTLSKHDPDAHQLSHYIELVPTEKNTNSKESIFFGLDPDIKAIEQIEWKYDKTSKQLAIDFVKRLDKTSTCNMRKWNIYYGKGDKDKLEAEYRAIFKGTVDQYRKNYKLGERDTGKKWWSSWAHFGKWITQDLMMQQIPKLIDAGFDSIILDDGWMKDDVYGDWNFDPEYFTDPKKMIESVNSQGKRFGLWMALFLFDKNSDIYKQHPEWILKNKKGAPATALGIRIHRELGTKNIFQVAKSIYKAIKTPVYSLDISRSEVRDYLKQKIISLAQMGVKDFKMDFLASPFVGIPEQKHRTILENQYLFWEDVRAELMQTPGCEDVKLSGCTVPLVMTPLFDSFRITNDSLIPPLFAHSVYKVIKEKIEYDNRFSKSGLDFLKKYILKSFTPNDKRKFRTINDVICEINSLMYEDAAAVLEARLLSWGEVLEGAVVDGMHSEKGALLRIFDPRRIQAANNTLKRLIECMPTLNITVGDDFTDGAINEEWKSYFNTVA